MNKSLIIFLTVLFSFAFAFTLHGQTGNLDGYISDNTGQPVEGANVILLGTNYGAASDVKGFFTIQNVPYGNYTLQVSFIGFRKETVVVSFNQDYKPINITLHADSVETEEVIVSAGKYKQKLSDVTVSLGLMMSLETKLLKLWKKHTQN